MRYIKEITEINHSRALYWYDRNGIFHYRYCKHGAGTFGPFYEKRFYFCNKHGAHFIIHNGLRYYSERKLRYT